MLLVSSLSLSQIKLVQPSAIDISKLPSDAKIMSIGNPGACGDIMDYFKARNGKDFPDLEKSPINFYRVKYKNKRGQRVKAKIMCKRLPDRLADYEDILAEKNFLHSSKTERVGRFMCVNGSWREDWRVNAPNEGWNIPVCEHRDFEKYLIKNRAAVNEYEINSVSKSAATPESVETARSNSPILLQARSASAFLSPGSSLRTDTEMTDKKCSEGNNLAACEACCEDRWQQTENTLHDFVKSVVVSLRRKECKVDCEKQATRRLGRNNICNRKMVGSGPKNIYLKPSFFESQQIPSKILANLISYLST